MRNIEPLFYLERQKHDLLAQYRAFSQLLRATLSISKKFDAYPSPLEVYLSTKSELDHVNLYYMVGAASSGGYRALLDQYSMNRPVPSSKKMHGKHDLTGAYYPYAVDGHLVATIIQMNSALAISNADNVAQALMQYDKKAQGKLILPHQIGYGLPEEINTLLGKNEGYLMMQWMMRIMGLSEEKAREFNTLMHTKGSDVLEKLGNHSIPKSEKIGAYDKLLEIFDDVVKTCTNKGDKKPVKKMILGFDWATSLGSGVEAQIALRYRIPICELRLNLSSDEYKNFVSSWNLKRLIKAGKLPLPSVSKPDQNSLFVIEDIAPAEVISKSIFFQDRKNLGQ